MAGTASPDCKNALSVRANMIWNSVGSITYFGCQWLITILVVRLSSGYDAAGTLSLAMSIYNIVSPLAVYRMYTYQVSDVNRENAVGEYFTFRLVTCAIALFCCLVYAIPTCPLSALPAIVLYVVFKFCALLIDILHGENQLNGRMDYIGRSLMLQGVLTLLAFAIVLYFSSSLELAVVAMGAVTLFVGAVYDFPRTRQFGPIKIGISRKKATYLLRHCFPIAIATVACSATVSVPRQMLAAMGGEAALGIYSSVAAPVAIVQMGASYIYNPLLSVFAEQFIAGRIRDFARTFVKVLIGIVCLGAVCAIGLELLGPFLLGLMYGDSILPYCYLLLPMIALAILTAFVWFASDMLVVVRCFVGSFVGNFLALLISACSCWWFITQFDMNGVSFAAIAAYTCASVLMVAILFWWIKKSRR